MTFVLKTVREGLDASTVLLITMLLMTILVNSVTRVLLIVIFVTRSASGVMFVWIVRLPTSLPTSLHVLLVPVWWLIVPIVPR